MFLIHSKSEFINVMRESGLDGLDIGRKSNIKKTIKESMKKNKTFKLGNHIFHQKKK